VQKADVAVDDGRHRSAARFGIPVRQRNGRFLVVAQDDAGLPIPQVIDQAVVQTAEAGARHDGGVAKSQARKHGRDDVAAPLACLVWLDRNRKRFEKLVRHAYAIVRRPSGGHPR
jgi:hypothetical protein